MLSQIFKCDTMLSEKTAQPHHDPKNIVVCATHLTQWDQAKQLAIELKLPLVEKIEKYDYALLCSPEGLALKAVHSSAKPFFIDFLSKSMNYRAKKASVRNEILARALGLKSSSPVRILDGTGGLGRDSFILATLGFQVTVLERSAIAYHLLKDGLHRAGLEDRIQLYHADTMDWLKNNDPPEVIYLDPMFPEQNKSARARHAISVFRDILGEDLDAELLLEAALACAARRVVVKRPRVAPPMIERVPPTYCLKGSSCRFDVYLK